MSRKRKQKQPVLLTEKYAKHPRYYVAYGSNLNVIQMQARCPRSMPVVRGMMPDKRLVFAGVLTIEDAPGEATPVAVWKVTPFDIAALDRYEGYPHLYAKQYTHVTVDGERVAAFYYVMNQPYDETPPVRYYYETCAEGYRDFRLDMKYLDAAVDRAECAEKEHADDIRPCFYCDEQYPIKEMHRLGRHDDYECDFCHNMPYESGSWLCGQPYQPKEDTMDEFSNPDRCEMCGEPIDWNTDELGEFATEDGSSVIGHAQCGLDRNLSIA